jgi:hypothetical protein
MKLSENNLYWWNHNKISRQVIYCYQIDESSAEVEYRTVIDGRISCVRALLAELSDNPTESDVRPIIFESGPLSDNCYHRRSL